MARIQIRLDAKDYALARRHAEYLGISVAEFMRREIREQLPLESATPWMRYAGMVQSGDHRRDASVDEIVYGSKVH